MNKKWYTVIKITITESTEDSEMIFFELDWKKNASYGQKYLREIDNRLCKVSNV